MSSGVDGLIVAAHELKAPLGVLRQLALNLDAENLELVQSRMITVSERALRQVTDLSKISRLEDGLFTLEPVAVRAVCDEVTRELRELYSVNDRRLSVSYRNRSRLAIANRDLLYSIIYNFCTNALHYSEEGTRSRLSVSDHKGSIRISVRDHGPALPAKIWRDLKSGALDQPTEIAMRPGSSGLGLYIASRFGKYMNAPLSATRHRDGTSFTLDLPVSAQIPLF